MDWQASSVSFQVQIKDLSSPTDLKASATILAKDTRCLKTANAVQKSLRLRRLRTCASMQYFYANYLANQEDLQKLVKGITLVRRLNHTKVVNNNSKRLSCYSDNSTLKSNYSLIETYGHIIRIYSDY